MPESVIGGKWFYHDGLVSSGNKALPEPMLTQIHVPIWRLTCDSLGILVMLFNGALGIHNRRQTAYRFMLYDMFYVAPSSQLRRHFDDMVSAQQTHNVINT